MLRRMNLMGICIALLFLVTQPVRELTFAGWQRPEVQAYVTAWTDKGHLATQALWQYSLNTAGRVQVVINGKMVGPLAVPNIGIVPANDDWRLQGAGCTLTTEQAEVILKQYNSPAQGYGYAFTQGCNRTKVDNAYVMAMFIHESGAGAAGVATHTRSSGNIKCTNSYCYQGFQVYADWAAGINAHFDLLKDYAEGRAPSGKKHDTIVSALREWAPPEDHNNQAQDCEAQERDSRGLSYPCAVKRDVRSWRNISRPPAQAVQTASVAIPKDKEVKVSPDISPAQGCVWTNTKAAYENNPKLRNVTIKPGESWSHNEAWQTPAGQVLCGDILAGGQCDVASRYYNVAKQLGLRPGVDLHAGLHGVQLNNISYEDSIVIDTGAFGTRNGTDLVIENHTNKTLRLAAELDNSGFRVKGWFE